jgi:hypothetical protein
MKSEKFINQVCTPEQAVKLKELGVDDKAPLLAWKDISFSSDRSAFALTPNDGSLRHLYYPAFTVAELGEMMPDYLEDKGHQWYYTQNKLDGWEVGFERVDVAYGGCNHLLSRMATEAQARAAMLIHLLENGIISPPKTEA